MEKWTVRSRRRDHLIGFEISIVHVNLNLFDRERVQLGIKGPSSSFQSTLKLEMMGIESY